MTVTVGSWVLPLAVTLIAFGWALWPGRDSGGGYLPDFTPLFAVAAALIASLLAWLVWALFR